MIERKRRSNQVQKFIKEAFTTFQTIDQMATVVKRSVRRRVRYRELVAAPVLDQPHLHVYGLNALFKAMSGKTMTYEGLMTA